ncbi:MAG: septum formation initiator family protein [Alphaproteobacteria bacterium]|nr:septum formation initiator family protein [Alphaproteobacteria bacterium]
MRELRRRARRIAGPALGLMVSGYFAYHLVEGDRGLIAWLHLSRDLRDANAALTQVHAERASLDRKVRNLRSESIDQDLLDEQVRRMLDLGAPNEIVISPPPAR